MSEPLYLKVKDGRIAYRKTEGAGPGVIFLGGFRSDMNGTKATALEAFCRKRGNAFLRFDYRGYGASSGTFEDYTIGSAMEDAVTVLTKLTKGPQILVGSSMGGWIALLAAIVKPRRVAGLIGIAAAPDFTELLVWNVYTPKEQEELKRKGWIMRTSDQGEPYRMTKAFIDDGRQYLLLDKEIPIYCPVRLIHGTKDDSVPWEMSFSINEKLTSQDVKTILIEGGDHNLNAPDNIEKILRVTGKMLESVAVKAA